MIDDDRALAIRTIVAKPSATVIDIRPSRSWQLINFRELWQFHELIFFLIWRDVKVRYKQTALGAAWAILQPVMMMVVFTIFFGRMAGVSGRAGYRTLYSSTRACSRGRSLRRRSPARAIASLVPSV